MKNQRSIYMFVNPFHGPSDSEIPNDWQGTDCIDQHIARRFPQTTCCKRVCAFPRTLMRLVLVRWLHSLPLALWCDSPGTALALWCNSPGTAHRQEANHRVSTTVCREKSLPATSSELCSSQEHPRQSGHLYPVPSAHSGPHEGFIKLENEA